MMMYEMKSESGDRLIVCNRFERIVVSLLKANGTTARTEMSRDDAYDLVAGITDVLAEMPAPEPV